MSELPAQPRLRVVSQRPQRRRAGFAFTREPVELGQEALGGADVGDVSGLETLLALVSDPVLDCVFVDADGGEHRMDAAAVEALRQVIVDRKAADALRTDNPVTSALISQLLVEPTELQQPEGAEGNAEGAAASDAAPEAKVADSHTITGAAAVDPQGTDTSSAEESEQSREAADDEAADRKASEDVGNQPEGTLPPPVAETDTASEESQPAGEETASPAAGAAGARTRRKAREG